MIIVQWKFDIVTTKTEWKVIPSSRITTRTGAMTQLIKDDKNFHLRSKWSDFSKCVCATKCTRVYADQYSPTIWPLTVSLSLGLSLFKSSLWSVERGQREGVESAEANAGTMRKTTPWDKQEMGIKMKERAEKRKKKGFISVSKMHVN